MISLQNVGLLYAVWVTRGTNTRVRSNNNTSFLPTIKHNRLSAFVVDFLEDTINQSIPTPSVKSEACPQRIILLDEALLGLL